jgi:hypothetical protein
VPTAIGSGAIGAQAARDDADRAQDGHPDEESQHGPEQATADLAVLEGRQHHVVGGPAEHPRVGDGQRPEEQ